MSTEFYNRNWRMPNSWNGSTNNNNKVSNYSMSFDGTEFIDCGTDIGNYFGEDYTGEMAISIWFKADTTSSDDGIFQFTGSTSLGEISAAIYANDLEFRIKGSTEVSESFTDTSNWHNLIINLFGPSGANQLYLDGVAFGSTFTYSSGGLDLNGETFNIGHYGGTRYFNGKLDHCCIFDYALSAPQITSLYGNSTDGVGNPMSISPKPKFYYPIGDYAAFNGSEYLVNNGALQDYVFDFVPNDYIDMGSDILFDSTNPFSCSVWCKVDSYSSPLYPGLFSFKTNQSTGFIVFLSHTSNYKGINFGSDNNFLRRLAGNQDDIPLNTWLHIVLTYDGVDRTLASSYKVYLNGVEKTQVPSGAFAPVPNENNIGGGNTTNSRFNGQLSNAQIFNTALPETGSNSVETLYNNGTPLSDMSGFTSLQGWWKLDASATFDGSNWSIPDDSSNSNTGTSSGMTAANLVQSDLNITTPYSRYAFDFNGIDESFASAIPGSFFSRNNAFSISVWTQSDTRLAVKGVLGNGSSGNCIRLRSANSGSPVFGIKYDFFMSGDFATSAGYHLSVQSDGLVWTADTWYNIVITYDGSSTGAGLKMYINNGTAKVSTSADFTTSDCVSSSDFAMGAIRQTAFSTGLDGRLSNVSIWNAELTSTQVTEIYNQGKPSNLNNHSAYSNLTNWYQLGENSSFDGTNWTVLDEKGTNNGTGANLAPAEDSIVNGVGTTGNGLSDGMGGADNIIGDAPYSTANAVSYGMGVDALSTSVPS